MKTKNYVTSLMTLLLSFSALATEKGSKANTAAQGACLECEVAKNSNRNALAALTKIPVEKISTEEKPDIRVTHPEYNAIGRVDARLPEGISHGTGVLINECLVLTNRHVVGEVNKSVKFRVGHTGDAGRPFAHEIEGTVVGTGGQGYPDYAHYEDWAIVKLKKSIGRKSSTGGVGSIPASFANENKVKSCPNPEIAGFPGNQNEELITHHPNCPFEKSGGGVFGFSCSIKAGESGSPVVCRYPDGSFKIIALARSSEGPNLLGAIDFTHEREEIKKIVSQPSNSCDQ